MKYLSQRLKQSQWIALEIMRLITLRFTPKILAI